MSRKMIGAILLPIPFAALPVVVVLAGALFSSAGAEEDFVNREDLPRIEQFVSTDVAAVEEDTLARANLNDRSEGCDSGLEGEF